eukprot:2137137-Alexandrium_andersonii.AAC.1
MERTRSELMSIGRRGFPLPFRLACRLPREACASPGPRRATHMDRARVELLWALIPEPLRRPSSPRR